MTCIFCVAIPAIVILYFVRKYRESKWGKCTNNVNLEGKVAIVTGANSGIGFETAKDLALRGATVVLACRHLDSAVQAADKIKIKYTPILHLVPMTLDLGNLQSVKEFANEILKTFPKVNFLINNAGVGYPNTVRKETNDGFEVHFGVNHIGHFLLTNLLLDRLKASEPSRIVIVSSLLHEKAKLYIDDLNMNNTDVDTNLYANSKLANMYFCRELAKRVEGSGVNVYAVCPGWVFTRLFRHHKTKWYHYIAAAPVAFFFMRSAIQGAQTVIYCTTEPELVKDNGYLYRDCKKYTSKHNFDNEIGTRLWQESERMLKEKGVL